MSYEVMTPSAARAIFEAIYWSPSVRWQVLSIEVLNPIKFVYFRRCETAAMAYTTKNEILADRVRQLRSSVVLRDVKYRVTAELVAEVDFEKHQAIFRRRAMRGQCFTQPYLGCREFACDWRLVGEEELLQPPISETRELGRMLHDIDFENNKPIFFDAQLINGVLAL